MTLEEAIRDLAARGEFERGGHEAGCIAQPPAAPDRKTFTIPTGYEAVRDSDGVATGEVRPVETNADDVDPPPVQCSSAATEPVTRYGEPAIPHAIKAIRAWQANKATSYTPTDILNDCGDAILTALTANEPQTALAPTDLNKVWGAAEACWASDAPRQCVDLLYYEILRLIKHPVTGFDINDVSAPSSPLTRPHGDSKL